MVLLVKNLPANAEDTKGSGLIPGSGRSPAEGHGISFQYSCLRVPWTEDPGGLQSTGLQRIRQNWTTNTLLLLLVYKNCKWSVSVQFSRSVISNSLQSHGLQHTRLPVHHQLPELAQTHVHWVSDANQTSPPAVNLSQHQGLFKWVSTFFTSGGQSTGVSVSVSTSGLPMNTQDWVSK